ncbi:MAG: WYL domain-containing protein, partial [Microbacterium sp.]
KPGEESSRTRRVQPLALVEYEGRWHVFGIDLDAAADRTFLLARIVGQVEITRTTFDEALREDAGERALAGLEAVARRNTALLEVNPGTEASLRLSRRGRPAEQGIHVPYVDLEIFADELASYGPEVRVVEPGHLRERVIARLEASRDRNGAR